MFRAMHICLQRLALDRTGATAIEYGLILALVAMVAVVGIANLGRVNGGIWGNVNDQVKNASTRSAALPS